MYYSVKVAAFKEAVTHNLCPSILPFMARLVPFTTGFLCMRLHDVISNDLGSTTLRGQFILQARCLPHAHCTQPLKAVCHWGNALNRCMGNSQPSFLNAACWRFASIFTSVFCIFFSSNHGPPSSIAHDLLAIYHSIHCVVHSINGKVFLLTTSEFKYL